MRQEHPTPIRHVARPAVWPQGSQWLLALLTLTVQCGSLALVFSAETGSIVPAYTPPGALLFGLGQLALVFLGGVLGGLAAAASFLLYSPEERGGCTPVLWAYAAVAVVVGATCWLGLLLPRWTLWFYLPAVELLGLFLAAWTQASRRRAALQLAAAGHTSGPVVADHLPGTAEQGRSSLGEHHASAGPAEFLHGGPRGPGGTQGNRGE